MSVKQATFARLQPESIRQQVAREIENKIFSGELAIGKRLPPERELSEALGVSRSLVNLAVLDLESMGFLRIVPRQGTFVADYKTQCTPQMLLSLMTHGSEGASAELFCGMMETRRLLEGECARLAAANAGADDLAKLDEALSDMRASSDPAAFSAANFRFHRALMAASGNVVYAMIFQSFEKVVLYYVKSHFTTNERMERSCAQHERLLDALAARDGERAMREVGQIMDAGIGSLTQLFAPGAAAPSGRRNR